MLETFNPTTLQWISIGFAGFILGLSKSGIKGISIIIVIILAYVFGEKASTGILLPMLIFADIFAVVYYNKHAQWHYIIKLLPTMIVGVLVGVWVGNHISEVVFKRIMAVIIIASVFIMFFMENRKISTVPTNKWFSNSVGFMAGFTTMVGNLAGTISDIYFLAMRLPKNEFIGTAAWLFFIVNVFKLPFHIFIWKTISVETLALNSVLIPMVVLGFFLGAYIVKLISNVNYRRFVLIVTALGGIIMLFR